MNIHTLYAQAHEELRQLSVQLGIQAERMAKDQHLHPLQRYVAPTAQNAVHLSHLHDLLTQYDMLLRLGIEDVKRGFEHATFTRVPPLPGVGLEGPEGPSWKPPPAEQGPEGPSMFRYCSTPGCSGPLHLKGQTRCADCLLAQQTEPEIPALEVTPSSEVKPDMPGWLK